MLKYIITGALFFFFDIGSNHLFAQMKYERESRLKEKEVPSTALDFVGALEIKRSVRWYLEEGADRTSVEAKFRLDNQKYSVEFDTIENLEDIEIQIKLDDLSKTLRDSVNSYLKQDCEKFKIRRIQIQYSGQRSVLLSKIKTGESAEDYITRYEIVVKCCHDKNVNLFEYLFNDSGQKLSLSQIVFKNTSHLEY